MPQENQRIETRHVGGSKRAFPARLPQFFTLRIFKIDDFLRVFSWTWKFATSNSMFCGRIPSIFNYISQNVTPATEFAPCRHLTQPWQCDSQKARNTPRLKCCACHAKWRWARPKCCAYRETATHLLRATQNDFRQVTKHVWMSRSATPATQNAATRRWKHPKVTPFAELTIGTAIRPSRERLQT